MTREEVESKLVRTDLDMAEITIYSDFLKSDVRLVIMSFISDETKFVISDYVYNCILDLVNLKGENLEPMKDGVYAHFESCISTTSYGIVPDDLIEKHNGDETKANRDFFGINNRDQAFDSLKLNYASIVQYDLEVDHASRYLGLFYDCSWDDEHGIQLECTNGIYSRTH